MVSAATAVAAAVVAASHGGSAMKSWAKGDRVVQPTYGPGTLVEVNEHHTVIDFDEHGRRTFATRLVVRSRQVPTLAQLVTGATAETGLVPVPIRAARAASGSAR